MDNAESDRSSQSLPRTAMIGVGSMGGAILAGLRGERIERPIAVTTHSEASAARFADADDVVAVSLEADPQANRKAVAGVGLVILAVKPKMISETVREIAGAIAPGTVVVSVAAGVPCAAIEAELPGAQVVRAMPNTPASIGRGVTGIAGGASASRDAVEMVRTLFAAVGSALVVREGQIDAVTAVSGSGPAYLFLYAEEMTAAAERLGFTREQAEVLALGTITGSAEFMRVSGEDPAQLRRGVTSPKGTTERALEVLREADLGELFDRALAANIRRSQELADSAG